MSTSRAVNDPAEIAGRRIRLSSRLQLVTGSRQKRNERLARYRRCVAVSDAVIVVVAVLLAQWLRFGVLPNTGLTAGQTVIPMWIASLGIIVAWLVGLRVVNSMDRRVMGSGSEEYSRVATACVSVFGVWAMIDVSLKLNVSRGFLLLALPVGTLALLVERWAWRVRLRRQHMRSENLERVLVVGDTRSAVPLMGRLASQPELGFRLVGVCLPPHSAHNKSSVSVKDDDVPVLGSFDDVPAAVAASGATTVAITSAEALGHTGMRELSWELESLQVDMVVSPGVTDVAGPRMTVRPVAGLPLLHIEKPRYEGANRLRKGFLDRVGAALILLAVSPVLLVTAIAIKLDSPGPVFYRGIRVGLNNKPFSMWKFRSMVVDADARKAELTQFDEGAGVLFKMRDDPRVTRVGAIIRRYSIDELPQLINVVRGEMSLVGPRPPLQEEVDRYDAPVARRMLVKPGLTGLWQVSGRSDLPWEEAVRLDLSYVENWSIMQDVVILWRTAKAVVARTGAY